MQRLERYLDRRRHRREPKKHDFLVTVRRVPEERRRVLTENKSSKENWSINCQQWNARKHGGRFCLNCKRLKAFLFASGYPGGCPTPSPPRSHFLFAGGLKSSPSNFSSFPTISGNETRMARNFAPEFNFNVRMDEDHFPDGLCMLHAQKAQQAEQRQMAAAMKASKKHEKAYTAMKTMQDIESNSVSNSVSPTTTVGYYSDDARSARSSDGNESSSSKTSRKPQKKGGKSKSGKGGKSNSHSPKAVRRRVK